MKRRALWLGAAGLGLVGASVAPHTGRAADHIDSPAAMTEPMADITDVYAWMSPDASKVNLILNFHHNAPASAAFSNAVTYAFHVTSAASYGATDKKTTQIVCKFFTRDKLECWAGGEYVMGGAESNLESASKKLRVFAGRRNDPFFFELSGFHETVTKVMAAAPSLTFDANRCPAVDAATSALLVKQLQSSGNIASATESKPAMDTFAGLNVLSLAVQIDKSLVTEKGPVLGVWASTHRAQ